MMLSETDSDRLYTYAGLGVHALFFPQLAHDTVMGRILCARPPY